jgi:hypothetical protein
MRHASQRITEGEPLVFWVQAALDKGLNTSRMCGASVHRADIDS